LHNAVGLFGAGSSLHDESSRIPSEVHQRFTKLTKIGKLQRGNMARTHDNDFCGLRRRVSRDTRRQDRRWLYGTVGHFYGFNVYFGTIEYFGTNWTAKISY
jgi:hypothetical protein